MIARIWNALLRAAPVRLWAMILAGPGLTAFAGALVWIVWKGPWPLALADHQLTILGWALWLLLGVVAVIIVALASARVKAAGPGGASLEIDGSEDAPRPQPPPQQPAAVLTTTTTAAVAAVPANGANP